MSSADDKVPSADATPPTVNLTPDDGATALSTNIPVNAGSPGRWRLLLEKAETDFAFCSVDAAQPTSSLRMFQVASDDFVQNVSRNQLFLSNTASGSEEVLTGFTGTGGTIGDMDTKNNVHRSVTSAGATNQHAEYVFTCDQPNTNRIPIQVFWWGRFISFNANPNAVYRIEAYNNFDQAWKIIDGGQGLYSTGDQDMNNRQRIFNLTIEHIQENTGLVRIRFTSDNAIGTGAGDIIRTDQLYLIDDSRSAAAQPATDFYPDLTIYVDTVNGTPGSVPNENGTVGNPCDNIADAVALLNVFRFDRLFVKSGSSVTLTGNYVGVTVDGSNYTATLSSPQADGATFKNGVYTGTFLGPAVFENCHLDAVNGRFQTRQCVFLNETTLQGDCITLECAGLTSAAFNGNGMAYSLSMYGWAGDCTVRNFLSGAVRIHALSGVIQALSPMTGTTFDLSGGFHLEDQTSGQLTPETRGNLSYQKLYDTPDPELDGQTRQFIEKNSARVLLGEEQPDSTAQDRKYNKLDGSNTTGVRSQGATRRTTVTFS